MRSFILCPIALRLILLVGGITLTTIAPATLDPPPGSFIVDGTDLSPKAYIDGAGNFVSEGELHENSPSGDLEDTANEEVLVLDSNGVNCVMRISRGTGAVYLRGNLIECGDSGELASECGSFEPDSLNGQNVIFKNYLDETVAWLDEDGDLHLKGRHQSPASTPIPTITQQPLDVVVRAGESHTFSVEANGNGYALSYQWYRDNTSVMGATEPQYTTASLADGDDGAIYRCKVSNLVSSVDSDNAELSVAAIAPGGPTIARDVVPYRKYVAGTEIVIDVTVDGDLTSFAGLTLVDDIPTGWQYAGLIPGDDNPDTEPAPQASGRLSFSWAEPLAAERIQFSYKLLVPVSESGVQTVSGYARYRIGEVWKSTGIFSTNFYDYAPPVISFRPDLSGLPRQLAEGNVGMLEVVVNPVEHNGEARYPEEPVVVEWTLEPGSVTPVDLCEIYVSNPEPQIVFDAQMMAIGSGVWIAALDEEQDHIFAPDPSAWQNGFPTQNVYLDYINILPGVLQEGCIALPNGSSDTYTETLTATLSVVEGYGRIDNSVDTPESQDVTFLDAGTTYVGFEDPSSSEERPLMGEAIRILEFPITLVRGGMQGDVSASIVLIETGGGQTGATTFGSNWLLNGVAQSSATSAPLDVVFSGEETELTVGLELTPGAEYFGQVNYDLILLPLNSEAVSAGGGSLGNPPELHVTHSLVVAHQAATVQFSACELGESNCTSDTAIIAETHAEYAAGLIQVSLDLDQVLLEDTTVDYEVLYEVPEGMAAAPASSGDMSYLGEGSVLIGANQSTGTFTIAIADDLVYEGPEHLVVKLLQPDPATRVMLGERDEFHLTIQDDESAPTVRLVPIDYRVSGRYNEGTSGRCAVELSAASERVVLVTLGRHEETSTAGSMDYALGDQNECDGASASIEVELGGTPAPTTLSTEVVIDFCDDDVFEGVGPELLALRILNISGGADIDVAEESEILYQIVDQDELPTVRFSSQSYEGAEGAEVEILVELVGARASALEVECEIGVNALEGAVVADEDDYGTSELTLFFEEEDTSKSFIISLSQDAVYEPNEVFTVSLVESDAYEIVAGADTTTVTIEEDTNLYIELAESQMVQEDAESIEFEVSLSEPTSTDYGETTVSYQTVAGTATAGEDFVHAAETLVFPAGGDGLGVVQVDLVNDDVYEAEEEFEVLFSTPSGALLDDAIGDTTSIRINDDDILSAPHLNFAVTSSTIGEWQDQTVTAQITVTLSQPSGQPVAFCYSRSDTPEEICTASIPKGETSTTLAVGVSDDNIFDVGGRQITVSLASPTGAAIGSSATHTLYVTESAPTSYPEYRFANVPSYIQTSESGEDIVLNIVPDGEVSRDEIMVHYTIITGDPDSTLEGSSKDYQLTPPPSYGRPTHGYVIFPGGEGGPKTLTIALNEDGVVEDQEMLLIELDEMHHPARGSYQSSVNPASRTVTIAIADSDSSTTTYYVNRSGGNNANSGSPDSPWKTISHALTAIDEPSEENPAVINVASGIYNAALGEGFPIQIPSHVRIRGGFNGSDWSRNTSQNVTTITRTAGRILEISSKDDVVIDGVTISGVLSSPASDSGAGVYLSQVGSDVKFSNCVFTKLKTTAHGGGAYLVDASPIFERCLFDECIADDFGATSSYGGAIYASGGSPQIQSCEFSFNQSDRAGALYGIDCTGLQVGGSLFHNNYANVEGPAILFAAVSADSELEVQSSTFALNKRYVSSSTLAAESIRVVDDADSTATINVYNAILWNQVPGGTSEVVDGTVNAGSAIDISYSDVYALSPLSNNNISSDPKFQRPSTQNFRIAANSPCYDTAGAVSAPNDVDMEGRSRDYDQGPDRGAYEYGPPLIRVYQLSFTGGNSLWHKSSKTFSIAYENVGGSELANGVKETMVFHSTETPPSTSPFTVFETTRSGVIPVRSLYSANKSLNKNHPSTTTPLGAYTPAVTFRDSGNNVVGFYEAATTTIYKPDVSLSIPSPPEEVTTDQNVVLAYQIENLAGGTMSDSPSNRFKMLVKLYLSTDSTLSSGTDALIGEEIIAGANANMLMGGKIAKNLSFTFPYRLNGSILTPGAYYLIADVELQFNNSSALVDDVLANNRTYEQVFVNVVHPDLQLGSVVLEQPESSSLVLGHAPTANLIQRVGGPGVLHSGDSYRTRMYLSSSSSFQHSTSAQLILERTTLFSSHQYGYKPVAYNGSALPVTVNDGSYWVHAIIDSGIDDIEFAAGGSVFEGDSAAEGNNVRTFQATVISPDLTISGEAVGNAAYIGQTIEVPLIVHNVGTGPGYGFAWFDRVYFSDQPDLEAAQSAVAAVERSNYMLTQLNSGEHYEVGGSELTVVVPESIGGVPVVGGEPYYVIGRSNTDASGSIHSLPESDLSNNIWASSAVTLYLAGYGFDGSTSHSVDEGDSPLEVTVSLSRPVSGHTIVLEIDTQDSMAAEGEDFTVSKESLTFSPGVTEQSFTIDIIDDALDEELENIVLKVTPDSSSILLVIARASGAQMALDIARSDNIPNISLSGLRIDGEETGVLTPGREYRLDWEHSNIGTEDINGHQTTSVLLTPTGPLDYSQAIGACTVPGGAICVKTAGESIVLDRLMTVPEGRTEQIVVPSSIRPGEYSLVVVTELDGEDPAAELTTEDNVVVSNVVVGVAELNCEPGQGE